MKRALVVIDMIEDFAREGGALYCGPSMGRIIPVIKDELARARAAGEPVIYLTDNHVPDDAEFQVFPPHAIAGTKGAEIIDELAPEDDEDVIPKR
ncbi:MAG: isochorismatase family cysteine hydrolase, partial [Chloroflexota bacterium]